jgi:hypothetical protein
LQARRLTAALRQIMTLSRPSGRGFEVDAAQFVSEGAPEWRAALFHRLLTDQPSLVKLN